MIWNGQVFDHSCLVDRPFDGDGPCGDALPADLGTLPLAGGQGSPGGEGGQTITYHSGTPSPTCTTKCGTLCTGYYCNPNPTGKPPDFTDPVNVGDCAFKTTTTQCNGSGGRTVCIPVEVCTIPTDMPTLSGRPGATHTGSCLASGAVSTCAMGPGGQSACFTSTTCTAWATQAPTTSTTPPPPPSPTPHSGFISIALQELVLQTDMTTDWSRQWRVYSAPLNRAINMCQEYSVFNQATSGATGWDQGFPPTLGPFKAQGFTCTYKGTEDKLGLLECDGVQNMWCLHGSDRVGCDPFNNPTLTVVVNCRW